MNDKHNIQKIYPLTAMQEGMLFHTLYGGNHAYFNQVCYRTSGHLDTALLEQSLDVLSLRHDILRTSFVYEKNERPIQVVLKNRRIAFYTTDISHLDTRAAKAFLEDFRQQDILRSFDLVKDPLMRLSVIKMADNEYEFVWSHHHILLDGWCIPVLLNELVTIYRALAAGQPVKLPPAVSFAAYIQWLEKQDKAAASSYWTNYLNGYTNIAGVPPVLFPEGKVAHHVTAVEKLQLSKEKTAQLETLARKEHTTMNVMFQSVWGILLAAYNNTNDVVYGNVVSGRPAEIPGVQDILGLFINTVPLRIRFGHETRFNQLLQQVHHDAIEGLPYHYSPLAEIQAGTALKRELLQHIIAVENYPLEEGIMQSGSTGDIFDVKEVKMFEQTNYHFHINVVLGEQMEVILSYNPACYTTVYMNEILQQFERIVDQVLANEDIPVKEIAIDIPSEVTSQPAYQLAYWKKQLNGVEPLQLPTDFPRPPIAGTYAAVAEYKVPDHIRDGLTILSMDENTTMFQVLLTAFHVMLYRYTGQQVISSGIPAPRGNTLLPLSADISHAPLFVNLLQQVKDHIREAIACQDVSLPDIAASLGIPDNNNPGALFRVTFGVEDSTSVLLFSGDDYTDYDLQMQFRDGEAGLHISVKYATDLFTAATIERMLGHYQQLLQDILRNPEQRNDTLKMLTLPEETQLLQASAEKTAGYPYHKTITDLIEEQVAATPDNVAVNIGTLQLTYRELNEKANQLAHFLRRKGVTADTLVPVCIDRSLEMIIALLGILKAGGAYVPVDPAYPQDRIAFMLEDTAAKVVISASSVVAAVSDATNATIILLDSDAAEISKESTHNPAPVAAPHHLAYVIYTSGSTGKPKGVLIEHRNVVRLFETDAPLYDFNSKDVWTMFHSFCFDFSVWEMYGALFYGGRLVIVPKEVAKDTTLFAALLQEEGVTILNQTPSAFYVLQDDMVANPAALQIRYVIFGGEALNPAAIRPWKSLYPDCRMINMYGITETTVHVTYQEIGEAEMASSSSVIGMPIPTLGLYILDARLQLSPAGIPGELYVSGAGLARGYLHRDELTRERFIANPFNKENNSRLYKTGDLARWLPDGNIEYLGRIDDQVKIRGFRIELGEIETALQQSGFVKQAVVMAGNDATGAKRLVAYLVPEGIFNRDGLLAYLKDRLPDYMVPAILIPLPYFQLTSNGKTDRKALPHPDAAAVSVTGYVAPVGKTEEVLTGIWQQLLHVERIGVHDNFFELGGHSLSAIRLTAAINKQLNAAVKVALVFQYPTIRQLAQNIGGGENAYTAIPLAPVQDNYPLSHAQQRLWLVYQLEEDRANYNLPVACTFSGALDVAALSAAFNLLVARHEILRTVFITVNGEPRQQVVFNDARFGLQVEDLRGKEDVKDRVAAATRKVFDLEQSPLFSAHLWQTGQQEYVFLLVIHHIITDAWSTGILMKELMQFYSGLLDHKNVLPAALKIQYKDFAVWDHAQAALPVYQEHRRYWLDHFRETVNVLELPADYPRQTSGIQQGRVVYATVPSALTDKLKSIAGQQGVSLFMLLLAGFKALLYRYTGQQDITVGTPAAGREHSDLDDQVGFYINTLALRSRFNADASFAALLEEVRKNTLAAYEHQHYPFDQLVEELAIKREAGRSPLFDIMLVLQNADSGTHLPEKYDGFDIKEYPLELQSSKFDLTIEMWETAGSLKMSFEYNTGLFSEARITRMTTHYTNLLAAVADNIQLPVAKLEYIGTTEKQHILEVLSGDSRKLPQDSTVTQLFEATAARYPDAPALADEQHAYTYRELNERAGNLAAYISRHHAVATGDVVAVVMSRTAGFITTMLAVLKAGAAYLPLERNTPADRIKFLLAQTNAALLITDDVVLKATLEDDIAVLTPEEACFSTSTEVYPLAPAINGDSLAYIMFTSGSTGTPKGVMVTHKSIVRLVKDTNYIRLNAADKILQTGSLSFDAATFEIWGALLNGGEVHLLDLMHLLDTPRLATAIREKKITTMWFTASWFNQLADQDPSLFRPLPHVLAGGEQLSPAHIRKVQVACPNIIITNGYGPTENTTFSICGEVPLLPDTPVPLGRPISHSTVYIVDRHLQPVGIGIPGEILLGGEGLSTGYMGDPERTAQQFIAHPFLPGEKVYRSGDLGKWLENGMVAFLGRTDDQVKIRGYRVEPGEIAHAIQRITGVKEAFVLVEKNTNGDKMLVCYYVPAAEKSITAFKPALKAELPDYMIPALFIPLEKAPLNKNGKLDRNALPGINEWLAQQEQSDDIPHSETAAQLLLLWEEVLGRKGIGMQDNFFESGGSSLSAYRIITRVETVMRVKIGLATFFKHPDIHSLAAWIDEQEQQDTHSIPLAPAAALYEASRAQQRLWIVDKLETEKNAFNITGAFVISGKLDAPVLEQAFRQVIARHEILRTVFVEKDGTPYQHILDTADCPVTLPVRVVATGTDIIEQGTALLREEEEHVFRLNEWPLIRFRLLTNGEEQVLVLNMHHIVSDGWSLQLFYTEALQGYIQQVSGNTDGLPPLRVQYKDFAAWQQQQLLKDTSHDEKYWLQQLQRTGEYPDLPLDRDRTRTRTYGSNTLTFNLNAATLQTFRDWTGEKEVSLFMICQSLIVLWLQQYLHTNDIVVGTTTAGREHPDLQQQLGFYVNVLALRTVLQEDDTFFSLLEKVKATTLAAYEHQSYPFDLLIEKLRVKRNLGRNPLFDVMIAFNDGFGTQIPDAPAGLSFTELPQEERLNKYDITFFIESDPAAGISIRLVYNNALFYEDTMMAVQHRLETLATQIVKDPQVPLHTLLPKTTRPKVFSLEDDFS